MPGLSLVWPTLPCRRYKAETVGAVVNKRLPHRSNRFLDCVHHMQASPASDIALYMQERNLRTRPIMQCRLFCLLSNKARCDSAVPHSSSTVAAISYARKIAPMRFPISALAPSSVIAKSAIAHTPSALAIPGPSPNRSNNA